MLKSGIASLCERVQSENLVSSGLCVIRSEKFVWIKWISDKRDLLHKLHRPLPLEFNNVN